MEISCAFPTTLDSPQHIALAEQLGYGHAWLYDTGFTGRRAMGYRAIPWSYMDAYIRAYRGLLRGETVEWEGARMRMLHPPGHAAARPVEVPIIVAALGPKGRAVARELGDGLFVTLSIPPFAREFSRVTYISPAGPTSVGSSRHS